MSKPDTKVSFLCSIEKPKNSEKHGNSLQNQVQALRNGFQHSASACYVLYQECVGCGSSVVETDIPIRCPSCLHVLNRTEQEFNEQVEVVMMWD